MSLFGPKICSCDGKLTWAGSNSCVEKTGKNCGDGAEERGRWDITCGRTHLRRLSLLLRGSESYVSSKVATWGAASLWPTQKNSWAVRFARCHCYNLISKIIFNHVRRRSGFDLVCKSLVGHSLRDGRFQWSLCVWRWAGVDGAPHLIKHFSFLLGFLFGYGLVPEDFLWEACPTRWLCMPSESPVVMTDAKE